MEIKFAVYSTSIGNFKLGYLENEVHSLTLIENMNEIQNNKNSFTEKVFKELEEYLDGKRKYFTFKLHIKGTTFQEKVWRELIKIPYGTTITYKELAIKVGNEKASRAVGMANNKNKVMIFIPCHRVVGSSGKLVGYALGLDIKEKLLELESRGN